MIIFVFRVKASRASVFPARSLRLAPYIGKDENDGEHRPSMDVQLTFLIPS
jgi:hypothetical protein